MPTLKTTNTPVETAAELLCSAVRAALQRRDVARVAIAGGSALDVWTRAAEALPMDAVRLTWVDERCVPEHDADSNRGETHRRCDARPEELPLWLDGETVDGASMRVRAGLASDFDDALDVTLLGMGGDGHIASLFVGRSWDGDRVIHVPDSPKPPPERMSLTHALLSTASTHVLYAVGESKRDAIARVLREDSELPASTLSGVTLVTTPGWDQP